jgi:iron complex outermembrane recepter protein
MSGSPIGTTTNNGGNGSVQIDLRGLGVDRTLTLINGQRVVDGGDFQTIPSTMIERVEILKDGASAVYGADAVAGVVNIITRQDFEGVQFDAQTADFFDMDSGRQTSFRHDCRHDIQHAMTQRQFRVRRRVRETGRGVPERRALGFLPERLVHLSAGLRQAVHGPPYDGTPEGGCYVLGSSRIPEGRLTFATQGRYMNEGDGLVPYDGRVYNYSPVNYIQTPYERYNFFTESSFDLNPSVRFYSTLRANFRESSQELAPLPLTTESDPAYPIFFNGQVFNGISADNYYLAQAVAAAGLIQEPVLEVRRRIVETTRRTENEITQFQAIFGFEGTFRDLNWDLTYNTGYRSRTDLDLGQFYGPHLANAAGPSADLDGDGVPECYGDINDPTTIIPGCVPIDLVGGAGTITREMLDYVGVELVDKFSTRQDIVGFSVTGDAFELPGGPLGWAAGAGYWGQRFTFTPDSAKSQEAVTGNVGAGTQGSLYNTSLFAEVLAPVFRSGAQALDIKGGLRFDDYNLFDSETTWQLGVEFQAIDSLKLRATAGTVFRAPTISDLFAGQGDSFPTAVDPCAVPDPALLPVGCAQVAAQPDSQIRSRVGGNPEVIPETGDTFTAGFVWTPSMPTGNLSLTVDYWQVDIEDGISSYGVQRIMDECYINQNAEFCSLVTRRPSDYSIDRVIDVTQNVTEQGAKGVDAEIRYAWDTQYGQFTASLLWAHLLERTKVSFPGTPEDDLSGRYTDPTAEDGGAYAEDKIAYSLQWLRGDLSVAYLGEYISSLTADTFCAGTGFPACPDDNYTQKIDSFLYHDLVASYEFTQTNTRVTASVTNITDEEPPWIEVGFNAGTDPSTYRLFGRGYWLRVEQKF